MFLRSTDNLWIQLLRYGFVGGTAFIVDYASLYVCTELLGIHHMLSAAIAFIAGLTVNYLLSILWVFAKHSSQSRTAEFITFAIIGVIGLMMNELIIYIGTDMLGIHYMITKLISTSIVFFWNFFARRFACFTNH